MAENTKSYCEKCQKTLDNKNFYQDSNGKPMKKCKKCLCLGINPHKPETAYPVLKEIDLPYIPSEWMVLVQRYNPDPNVIKNPQSILGRYIAKMRLSQFKEFTWADTDRFVQEHREILEREEKKKEEENQKYMEALVEQGKTKEEAIEIMKELENPTVEFDFGSMLSKDEKMMMTIKWGKMYDEDDWIKMERMYQGMEESFDIATEAHRDYLVKICKTSLKMDKAMDVDDVDGFTKLSKTYDTLMKSAKFTAAQTKEKDEGLAICEMFAIAEKEKGIIEKYTDHFETPLDVVDITIRDMQKYVENLVKNELNLGAQIEAAIKMMELQAESDRLNDEASTLTEEEIEEEELMSYTDYEAYSDLLDEDEEGSLE